jgi:hypothetical protein
VIGPAAIDHGGPARFESLDLGVEVVGVDVEVDACLARSDVLGDNAIRLRRVVENVVLGQAGA